MKDTQCIILWDYRRLDNWDKVAFGFEPMNPIALNIKKPILNSQKDNQFSGKNSEYRYVYLTHFFEACDTTNPSGISKLDKRLRLFVYSLTRGVKYEDERGVAHGFGDILYCLDLSHCNSISSLTRTLHKYHKSFYC